jgi:hypothetical protein
MRMLKCTRQSGQLALKTCAVAALRPFMRVGDDVLALAGCTSPAMFPAFSARERANVDP